MPQREGIDRIMGKIPSGISILTIGTEDKATGMLASWVMQAGFEPPMVSVAIKQGRYIADWITDGQPFNLNVVGQSQGIHLKHFGKGFEPGTPAFEGVEIVSCPRGVPILRNSLGHLQCEPRTHVDSGDHRIFLAEVIRGAQADEELSPMVHIRNSGSHY